VPCRCSKALRCEAIGDFQEDCARRAAQGQCSTHAITMLKSCLKSCSELDLDGLMRFHLPHNRTTLSPLIDLPGPQPHLASFFATPPQATNADSKSRGICDLLEESSGRLATPFVRRLRGYRRLLQERKQPWNRFAHDLPSLGQSMGARFSPTSPSPHTAHSTVL
jgi:hypothetical protein